jgi:hypothetical protein
MDERARKIFNEAWATIDRTADYEAVPPRRVETLEKPRPVVEVKERKRDTMSATQKAAWDAEWNRWWDTRFKEAINEYNNEAMDCLIPLVFTRIEKIRDAADEKIEKLEAKIAELREEIAVANARNVTPISSRKDVA